MRTIFRNHTIYGPTDLSCKFKTERERNSNCKQGNKLPTSLASGININNVKNVLDALFWWHITWQLPFVVWLETGEGKGKTYSCWSFFIWENALLCRDMMALSLRSLENSQIQHSRLNYGRACPSGLATPHCPPTWRANTLRSLARANGTTAADSLRKLWPRHPETGSVMGKRGSFLTPISECWLLNGAGWSACHLVLIIQICYKCTT